MNEDAIRNTLVVLLQALEQTTKSNALVIEALTQTVPGFQDALRVVTEKERQKLDTPPMSADKNTVGHSSIELANVLARVLAKASL